MATTFRAALAVLMLAGFYVVALAVPVALGVASLYLFGGGNEVAGVKVGGICVVVSGAVFVALGRVGGAKPRPRPGLVLSLKDAPELWAFVSELARSAKTRVPDEIRLVPDVNAAVSEDARWLGLLPGRRRLYVGVPLIMGLDVAALTSVLAHELGHYSRSHTRLAPIAYAGQAAIFAAVDDLAGSLVGWLLRHYAKLHLLVSAGVTRRQELEADALSVRIAGRETALRALRESRVIDVAWSFYDGAYLAPGWQVGVAPTADRFFAGFGELLTARKDELSDLRAQGAPEEQSRWDTHPSIAVRVRAMEKMPSPTVSLDDRPASALVPGLDAMATRLAQDVVNFGDRRRVGWEELTAVAVRRSEQRAADVVYRAAAQTAGQPRATLATVLDLIGAGRGDELMAKLRIGADSRPGDGTPGDRTGGPQGQPNPLIDTLTMVLGAAAVQAGVYHWQHSWTGPPELVDAAGEVVALAELAANSAGPTTVDVALERLAALGVDVQRAGRVGKGAKAQGAQFRGGIASVDVDGSPHDVVLFDRGLILVPSVQKTAGGKIRMAALLRSGSVVALANRHRLLAFEDVRSTTIRRRTPLKIDLILHSGRTVTFEDSWAGEQLTKDSATIFVALAEELSASPVLAG